jgi:tetratricopeptide (TPR) repeat protein
MLVRQEDNEEIQKLAHHFGDLEQFLKETLESRRATVGAQGEPDVTTLEMSAGLARLYFSKGRFADAEDLYCKTLGGQRRALGEHHRQTLITRLMLAEAIERPPGPRRSEAKPELEDALKAIEHDLGPDDYLTARATWLVARAYLDLGLLKESLPLYQRAVEALTHYFGPDHLDVLNARSGLGILYEYMGRHSEAESVQQAVLKDFQRVMGPDHTQTLVSCRALCEIYRATGRIVEEEALHRDVLARHLRAGRKLHPDALFTRGLLANNLERQGRVDEAEVELRKYVAGWHATSPPDEHESLGAECALAYFLGRHSRLDEAEAMLRSLLDRAKSLGKPLKDQVAGIYIELAQVRERQGFPKEAELLFRQAEEGLTGVENVDRGLSSYCLFIHASFLHRQSRDSEAEPIARQSLELTSPESKEFAERRSFLEGLVHSGDSGSTPGPNAQPPKGSVQGH